MASFTIHNPDLLSNGATIEVSIASNLGTEKTHFTKLLALIDTGSSTTVISQNIIDKLGWEPIGKTKIHTPSSTNVNVFVYEATIIFPNNAFIEDITIIGAPLAEQDINVLIGRDILQNSILIYNGNDNSFSLSF